jgi:hypothetical protein
LLMFLKRTKKKKMFLTSEQALFWINLLIVKLRSIVLGILSQNLHIPPKNIKHINNLAGYLNKVIKMIHLGIVKNHKKTLWMQNTQNTLWIDRQSQSPFTSAKQKKEILTINWRDYCSNDVRVYICRNESYYTIGI